MAQILYILPGYVPPESDPQRDQFFYLSDSHEGDVLLSVWGRGDLADTTLRVRNFRYHVTHSEKLWSRLRPLWDVLFMVSRALSLHRRNRFDVMVAYGTKPGFAALIIKWLTGIKFIAEMPGTPAVVHLYDQPRVTFRARFRNRLSRCLLWPVLRCADHVHLGYPGQLDGCAAARRLSSSVFHYCVPVSTMQPTDVDGRFLLFLGFPWYLKGVDVLIKAFHRIAKEFPEYRLKIVGHCPNREYFEKLRNGEDRIEFSKGIPYSAALELISSCSVLVLPSRTESMGRVLLEAMAFRKPIVASDVEGIPYYIKHEETGLLFESGNVGDLALQLKRVLSDGNLAASLAKKGYETVHERYSEVRFAEQFNTMIGEVLTPQRAATEGSTAVETESGRMQA